LRSSFGAKLARCLAAVEDWNIQPLGGVGQQILYDLVSSCRAFFCCWSTIPYLSFT
jgi:hypothetical protein